MDGVVHNDSLGDEKDANCIVQPVIPGAGKHIGLA